MGAFDHIPVVICDKRVVCGGVMFGHNVFNAVLWVGEVCDNEVYDEMMSDGKMCGDVVLE